jgi:NAD(P)-dependent dehydrogenase (short-subunit alcohol dehydrogenase family)
MERTVLVTGTSSGIGLATVLHLANLGFRVVGVVPDEAGATALRRAADERSLHVEALVVDLADPQARVGLVERVGPWAIVNNAGYMNAGQIRDVPLDDVRRQFEVMVLAPADLARQALPAMVDRGQGRIVNLTSSAAHTSTPLTGWYAAAKAALREVNDALRVELRGTGVEVLDVEPGGYRTEIWSRAEEELRRRRSASGQPAVYDRVLGQLGRATKLMGDPQEVAERIGTLLTAGVPAPHQRLGLGSGILRSADALVPDRLWDLAVGTVTSTGRQLRRVRP